MPSVHVGWAILVAIMVISGARSRWRWLAVLYPVATTVAVIVTANHYWMDGIVAALILVLVLAAQAGLARLWASARRARLTSRAPRVPANVFGLRLFPYRPTWDHRGTNDPINAGGNNGRSAIPERDRAPARCDRAP